MADALSTLRDELVAGTAVLAPQIRGLGDLMSIPSSPGLHDQLAQEQGRFTRRQNLLAAATAALDALTTDGYPVMGRAFLPPELFDELAGEVSDISAGRAAFEADPPAARIAVDLGEPSAA